MCVSGVTGSDLRTRIETIMANRLGRRLHTTGRLLLAGAALIVIGAPIGIGLLDAAATEQPAAAEQPAAKEQPAAQGQTTERFEVATIRPNKTAKGFEGLGFRAGRFSATGVTLQDLITSAYEMQPFEIFGGPGWATSDRFDIAATMEPSPTGSSDQGLRRRRLLRALLAERFNLVVHEERREMPVFELRLARTDRKLGARLRPFEGECGDSSTLGPPPEFPSGVQPASDPRNGPQWCLSVTSIGRISARGTMLSDLATTLARFPAVRRRVIDRTELTGRFDFDLEWTPLVTPPGPAAPGVPSDAGPTLFTALQEQLGLKLESTKETIAVLVIDSVNQPTPN
jgi:uncharacterized protein (TIGR03435 family)